MAKDASPDPAAWMLAMLQGHTIHLKELLCLYDSLIEQSAERLVPMETEDQATRLCNLQFACRLLLRIHEESSALFSESQVSVVMLSLERCTRWLEHLQHDCSIVDDGSLQVHVERSPSRKLVYQWHWSTDVDASMDPAVLAEEEETLIRMSETPIPMEEGVNGETTMPTA